MREIVKTYVYMCDAISGPRPTDDCGAIVKVSDKDAVPKYDGALFPDLDGRVQSADDADKVMKFRYGWRIGSVHLCPSHRHL